MANELEIKKDCLKVVILSSLLTEAIDNVKNTSFYKQQIKQVGNRFQNMLEPFIKQTDQIYDVAPEMTTNFFRELDELVDNLSEMNLVDLILAKQIQEHFMNNKEKFRKEFSIEFTKLNT